MMLYKEIEGPSSKGLVVFYQRNLPSSSGRPFLRKLKEEMQGSVPSFDSSKGLIVSSSLKAPKRFDFFLDAAEELAREKGVKQLIVLYDQNTAETVAQVFKERASELLSIGKLERDANCPMNFCEIAV